MDINYFDLLSNEVITNIIEFVDVLSLFRLCSSNKRLHEFNNISNDRWRKLYATKWYVDERELAQYKKEDWYARYHTRVMEEREYKKKIEKARESWTEPERPDNDLDPEMSHLYDDAISITIDPITKEELVWFKPSKDPFYTLLTSESPDEIESALELFDMCFDPPFKRSDIEREMPRSRFEFIVTAMNKHKAKMPFVLEFLYIFDEFFYAEGSLTPKEGRPFGMIALLVDSLDAKFAQVQEPLLSTGNYDEVFSIAANSLQRISVIDPIPKFWVPLEIVPRIIALIEKTQNNRVALLCITALGMYIPKANHPKYYQNTAFMKRICEMLKFVTGSDKEDFYETVMIVLDRIASMNANGAMNEGLITTLVNMIREAANSPQQLVHSLISLQNFAAESDDVCLALARDESAMDFIFSLVLRPVNTEMDVKIMDPLLNIIHCTLYAQATGTIYTYFMEKGYFDKLLPMLKLPHPVLLYSLYDIFNCFARYGRKEVCMDTVTKILEPYFDTLVANLNYPEVKKRGIGFWITYSCGVPPPREISRKLLEIIIPALPTETDEDMRGSCVDLLANIVEVDKDAFIGLDLTSLLNFLAENIISFIYPTKMEIDENNDEMDVDEEDDEEIEENKEKEIESPWPLYLLSYLMQFDQVANLAVKNEQLINKLFNLYKDDKSDDETHWMIVYLFSNLLKLPGWDSQKALDCIEDFAESVSYDLSWSFLFVTVEPYLPLFKQDNPPPLVVLASWFIAHMSTKQEGRAGLKKLDPSVVKWLDEYSHSRVQFNMTQYHRNMKRKMN